MRFQRLPQPWRRQPQQLPLRIRVDEILERRDELQKQLPSSFWGQIYFWVRSYKGRGWGPGHGGWRVAIAQAEQPTPPHARARGAIEHIHKNETAQNRIARNSERRGIARARAREGHGHLSSMATRPAGQNKAGVRAPAFRVLGLMVRGARASKTHQRARQELWQAVLVQKGCRIGKNRAGAVDRV